MERRYRLANNGTGETYSIYDGEMLIADVVPEHAVLVLRALEAYASTTTTTTPNGREAP